MSLWIAAILIYAFGASTFGTIFGLWAREFRAARRSRAGRGPEAKPVYLVDGAISLASVAWFVVAVLDAAFSPQTGIGEWILNSFFLALAYLYPPLIMHSVYTPYRAAGRLPGPAWKAAVVAAYAVSLGIATLCLLGFWRVVELIPQGVLSVLATIGIGVMFGVASVYSILAMRRCTPARESTAERSARRWWVRLFLLMTGLSLVLVMGGLEWVSLDGAVVVALRSLPLLFLFVGTYFESRFEFFDLFVKRGLWLLATVVALAAALAILLPALGRLDPGPRIPWIAALALLPLAAALPWLYRALGRWLDSVWLGREHTPSEALQLFLGNLRGAASEPALLEAAERTLGTIFRAPAQVDVGPNRVASVIPEAAMEVELRSGSERVGRVWVGTRGDGKPFFSEDRALLAALADVLTSMLDNVRLQEKRKELALHASRSELKALQAQIRPHFLFNALNAIAGLIRKDPELADRTVEQLAEVFRYTLRRSESEWVLLGEELEFVQAYLDVERARFGARLHVEIRAEESVRETPIPTLVVQTLVENAVKHGIAAVVGPGRLEVTARRDGVRTRIDVADNGPGFREGGAAGASPAGGGEGHGLQSVRRRLQGYFGDQAALAVRRDGARGMTVVSIELPCESEPPVDRAALACRKAST
jgi:GAF domain-containing protein